MSNNDFFIYAFIFFIMIISLFIYFGENDFQLKCIVSTIDGNKYCVRERKHLQKAVDLLATVTNKCKKLVEYIKEKYPNNENVERLVRGFNPKKVMETLPTSEYTAYSENKGEKLAFCLNQSKSHKEPDSKIEENTKLIDLNTLTFVAIHELSHIMTESEGHKQVFWQNFKFLLAEAKEANIYIPVDYKKSPVPYCGMSISDNPLYDLA